MEGARRKLIGNSGAPEKASKWQYGCSVKRLKSELEDYNAQEHELGEDRLYVEAAASLDSSAEDLPESPEVPNDL